LQQLHALDFTLSAPAPIMDIKVSFTSGEKIWQEPAAGDKS